MSMFRLCRVRWCGCIQAIVDRECVFAGGAGIDKFFD